MPPLTMLELAGDKKEQPMGDSPGWRARLKTPASVTPWMAQQVSGPGRPGDKGWSCQEQQQHQARSLAVLPPGWAWMHWREASGQLQCSCSLGRVAGLNATQDASHGQWHRGVGTGEGNGQSALPHTRDEAKGVELHTRDGPLDRRGEA